MNERKGVRMLRQNAFYVFFSILIGFLVGAILLVAAGISPIVVYTKLLNNVFGSVKYLTWSIVYAAPLIFTGLSVAFSFQTGVFNIGVEGQFVVGSLAACVVGILFPLPSGIHAIVCMLAAVIVGAAWSAIVGVLKVKRGVNEVLSYIMFNWIAFYLSNYIVNVKWIHRGGGGEATKDVLDSARILFSKAVIRATKCGAANWGILLAIVAAIIIWFVMKQTTVGYELRAVGLSQSAAEYGGINTKKSFLMAMSISGALAGLGGAVQILGMSGRISQFASQEKFGFQGITVALIASSNPIGCIFAGMFYGAMKYGGAKLSLVDTPSEVVDLIMGTIIFSIAISRIVQSVMTRRIEKRGEI